MRRFFCLTVILMLATSGVAFAQSPASNKAFFGRGTHEKEVIIAEVSGAGWSQPVKLIDIPQALKTSSGGAVSAILSMEAVLWTYNLTTAIVNGGRSSSSSRATIKAWVEIDGKKMQPGEVVFADRLQATGLTANLLCSGTDSTGAPFQTCIVTGDIALELFQMTKDAKSFVFYLGPLGSSLHSVSVWAQAVVECRNSVGEVITCPAGTLAGYENASTMAAIGTTTLLVEEQQNWGSR